MLPLAILSHFISDFYNNTTYFRNVIILSVPSKILYFFILQSISLFIGKRKTRELSSDKSTLFLAWFHTYIQEKNQEFLEMQLRLQKEYDNVKYFDALRKQDEKEKILIHDIRKHLMSIAELNEQKETQKIASYINQIVQSSDLQSSVRSCDNDLLNTILFRYKQQFKEFNVSFIANIQSNCIDFLSEYDMTALFSNLLDNALDATKNLTDSFVELSVTAHNDSEVIITMINSCAKNPFDSKEHRLISSKKNKLRHGYGMTSIQQIIKKFDGNSRLYFDENDSTFHSVIILKTES